MQVKVDGSSCEAMNLQDGCYEKLQVHNTMSRSLENYDIKDPSRFLVKYDSVVGYDIMATSMCLVKFVNKVTGTTMSLAVMNKDILESP